MPQLDKFTFAPQLFWVFILFLFLYVYFLRISLPSIATTLKLRNKKLSRATSSLTAGLNNDKISDGSMLKPSYYLSSLLYDSLLETSLRYSSPNCSYVFLRSSKDSLRNNFMKYVFKFS